MDKENQIGTFREIDCAVLTKCRKSGSQRMQTQKSASDFYSILGVMKGSRKGWATRIKLIHCMTSGKETGHSMR